MRPELKLIEQIERYLTQSMDKGERDRFEQKIEGDPTLKEAVKKQKLLMQASKRASIRKAIQGAEKSHFLSKALMKTGIIAVGAVTLLVGAFFLGRQVNKEEKVVVATEQHMDMPIDSIKSTKPTSINPVAEINEGLSDTEEEPVQELAASTLDEPQKVVDKEVVQPAQQQPSEQFYIPPATGKLDVQLPEQHFRYAAEQPAILESDNDLLYVIPSHAFVDEMGNPVNGEVEIKVQEAITPTDILKSGLSTIHNEKYLETAGMFNIEASQNGIRLFLAKDAEILVEVPTDTVRADMQLFEGELNEDGIINWVDPRPLENYLTSVDITTLDFYPPEYVSRMTRLEENWDFTVSKPYLDSFYYSFELPDFRNPSATSNKVFRRERSLFRRNDLRYVEEGLIIDGMKNKMPQQPGIRPSQVRAIWDSTFNNTNLATYEFEERMKVIHQTCNPAILNLYVNNLDKKLWELDQKAANMLEDKCELKSVFEKLAKRKDGRVQTDDALLNQLQEYYTAQQKAYRAAVNKFQQAYQNKQDSLDVVRNNKDWEFEDHVEDYFTELQKSGAPVALVKSTESQTKKSGKVKRSRRKRRSRRSTYRARVRRTGWHNMDALLSVLVIPAIPVIAVPLAIGIGAKAIYNGLTGKGKKGSGTGGTVGGTPVPYPENSRKLSVELKLKKEYSNVFVYLVPAEYETYLRLTPDITQSRTYTRQVMNDQNYHVVVAGILPDTAEYFVQEYVGASVSEIEVTTLDKPEQYVRQLFEPGIKESGQQSLMSELEYRQYVVKDDLRKEEKARMQAFRDKVFPVVYPCKCINNLSDLDDFEKISQPAEYVYDFASKPASPKDMNLRQYAKTLEFYLENNHPEKMRKLWNDPTVVIAFIVNKDGSLRDFSILRDTEPAMGLELIDAIKTYGNWVPAEHNGQIVAQKVTFPITLKRLQDY